MKNINITAIIVFTWCLFSQQVALAEQENLLSTEWQAYLQNLAPIGGELAELAPDQESAQLREELYSRMFSEIAAGYIGLLYADPKHPDFWPVLHQAFNNVGVPNPDNVYLATPIDDDGVYKLEGFRGTVKIVNFQVGKDSILARGEGGWGPTLANFDLDDGVTLGDKGEFEIIVSPERPKGYPGDWWELPKGATYLLVRQSAYDWINETDANITIDRLDTPAAKPRPTAAEISEDLQQIAVWVKNYMTLTLRGPIGLKAAGLTNKVAVRDLSDIAGLKSQVYSDTFFDLTEDEALVLTIDMPNNCRYWNYQLANEMWSSLDFMHRQTSLNGLTTSVDPDGFVRIVVSAKDPGVNNWLDTLGYKRGVALGRWERCNKSPVIAVNKVKSANLEQYLHPGAIRITAEQREDSIRLRRKGAQLRRRW